MAQSRSEGVTGVEIQDQDSATRVDIKKRADGLNAECVDAVITTPASLLDMAKDDTMVPVNNATSPVTIPFIDDATANPFSSKGVILENLEAATILYFSYDGGVTYHRLQPNRAIAMDSKGANSVVLTSTVAAPASHQYNLHVWG